MKIAVCISGQPRSWKEGFKYLKQNLLDVHPGDVDIFWHSWRIWHNWWDTPNLVTDMIDHMAPTNWQYEEYLNKEYLNNKYPKIKSEKHSAFNIVSMFYSVFMANSLKRCHELKKGITYDWVIKTRFDFALNTQINFEQLEKDKVYVPNLEHHHQQGITCNDQWAVGSSEVIDLYSSTYINLDRLYKLGMIMNGEHMLSGNLQINELINDKMVYINMNMPFPPGEYNGTPHALIRDDMDKWQ